MTSTGSNAASSLSVSSEATRIGWIGTGVMGLSMCSHILAAGYKVSVYSRTKSKFLPLLEKGATAADSPAAVASQSDIVFTMLGYPSDVREVLLGEGGVLQELRPGGILVDMTTSEPSLAKEISDAAEKRGCHSIDAPVSGGDKGARDGKLAIMAGGSPAVLDHLSPILSLLGSTTHLGPPGSGQSCKLGNQIAIASTMVGMVEGMIFAHRAGLDVPTFLSAISGGAAGSRSLDLYSARILKRDFQPGFFVKHFVKDLGIALGECQRLQLALPGLALAQQLYLSLEAHGDGDLGTQALVLALERLNDTRMDSGNEGEQ